jgi:hypothetical protein
MRAERGEVMTSNQIEIYLFQQNRIDYSNIWTGSIMGMDVIADYVS